MKSLVLLFASLVVLGVPAVSSAWTAQVFKNAEVRDLNCDDSESNVQGAFVAIQTATGNRVSIFLPLNLNPDLCAILTEFQSKKTRLDVVYKVGSEGGLFLFGFITPDNRLEILPSL